MVGKLKEQMQNLKELRVQIADITEPILMLVRLRQAGEGLVSLASPSSTTEVTRNL